MNILQFLYKKNNNGYSMIKKIRKIRKIKYFSISKNNIAFIFFLISYFLFLLSLEKCYEGESKCSKKVKWIKKKIIQEIISSIITSYLFYLIMLNKISKLHLIHFLFIYFFFYKYSHGLDFDDHGHFNLIGYFIIIAFNLIFLLILKGLIYIGNKRYFSISIIIISFLIIICLIYFLLITKYIDCKLYKFTFIHFYFFIKTKMYSYYFETI